MYGDHLEPYKNRILSGEFEGGFDVYRSVEDFAALYQCCLTQYCGKETYAVTKWESKRIQNVIHVQICIHSIHSNFLCRILENGYK